ncbi:MAG: hypothetical protein M3Q69_08110 [Acidobacteriota bacterium]|nr:hypothetical protein [Acidobacteriota bacterium]
MRLQFSAVPAFLFLFLASCASTAVDMNEPRRIVGTENSVRVDAQVTGDEARPGATIPITYEITNQRETPIAVADLIPETSYDAESHTITVNIGAEVPGNETVPRLIAIRPGEKRTFSVAARLRFAMPPTAAPLRAIPPAAFRLKLNFLGDTTGFESLIEMKERAIADAKLADELFPLWLERNEIVTTNSIPMRWLPRQRDTGADASM